MTTLRKACRSCTSSKRKCIVQLPKCTRCAQKGLECTYDLEPLRTASASPPDEAYAHKFNPSNGPDPGYCVMKTVRTRPYIDPEICDPGNADVLGLIRQGFLTVPGLVRAGDPSTFVHPKLQLHAGYDHFAALIRETGKIGMSLEGLAGLIQLDIRSAPVPEVLTALQALLIYLATFLYSPDPYGRSVAEGCLVVLSEWTQTLYESARAGMPRNQSPWQDWLFGESARRTIVMAYALNMALSATKDGYCSNWLFFESLPFDSRAGLWMAKSPQAWIAAAGAKSGGEVGEKLNSYHEFAERAAGGTEGDFCGDVFLRLLEYYHNGGPS
ncbi:uncharacterized protein DNG_09307 [Cephalotrichum gorgonifer]|uniref:Zn(2)-C6 fungal-type domain-containing protein n=1 Tax=Cephalotrichum gorgonifer TaxID=2041049 RepID=A0AAE8T005_9PEZI|nr:uncharacterized protein DNG_09307 [Cephalotrichum gorgonifer]